MKKLIRIYATGIFIALSVLLLTGCGGGGGGSNPPPNNANTDWDQLVWDQDNWS